MAASKFTMLFASPVPGTPVGRTTVTLICPCVSTRSAFDTAITAIFVALYTAAPATP